MGLKGSWQKYSHVTNNIANDKEIFFDKNDPGFHTDHNNITKLQHSNANNPKLRFLLALPSCTDVFVCLSAIGEKTI